MIKAQHLSLVHKRPMTSKKKNDLKCVRSSDKARNSGPEWLEKHLDVDTVTVLLWRDSI